MNPPIKSAIERLEAEYEKNAVKGNQYFEGFLFAIDLLKELLPEEEIRSAQLENMREALEESKQFISRAGIGFSSVQKKDLIKNIDSILNNK